MITSTALQQRRLRGGVAESVDLVVDRAVLLDVGVARRDVRLGLVVVVVTDEVLDPVVREELPHLVGQLRSERFVGSDDQGRTLHRLDGPGDSGALAAAGDTKQGLEPITPLDSRTQRGDGLRLIPAGPKSATTWNRDAASVLAIF